MKMAANSWHKLAEDSRQEGDFVGVYHVGRSYENWRATHLEPYPGADDDMAGILEMTMRQRNTGKVSLQ